MISAGRRTSREYFEISLNVAIPVTIVLSYFTSAALRNEWRPPIPTFAALGLMYLLTLALRAVIALFGVTTGRKTIDEETVQAFTNEIAQQVLENGEDATSMAVVVRPVRPAPFAGHMWTAVAVTTTDQRSPGGNQAMKVTRTDGWALRRHSAVHQAEVQAVPAGASRHNADWRRARLATVPSGRGRTGLVVGNSSPRRRRHLN